jgi:hypothetical protein
MFGFPHPAMFRDNALHAQTSRIRLTLDAAMHSIERLRDLRAEWELRPLEARSPAARDEILQELAVASGFYRQAELDISRAQRGPIFVTTWQSEMAEIRQAIDEFAAWVQSALDSPFRARPDGRFATGPPQADTSCQGSAGISSPRR